MQEVKLTRNNAADLWIIQAITGSLMILIVGLHMIVHHFVVEGGLRNHQQVLDLISDPIIFIIELSFIIVVTIHAMLGIRAILLDLNPSGRWRSLLNWGTLIITIITLAYGVLLAVMIQSLV